MERQKITVITPFHDAHGQTIEATLKSLHWADEVLIIDDESSSEHRPILEKYTSSIYTRKLDTFPKQWTYAMSKAKHEWIFFVASDEVVSTELAEEILKALEEPTVDGFVIRRLDYMFGRWIRHGGFAHRHMRLFRADTGYWSDATVHEEVLLPEGSTTQTLDNVVYHFSYVNASETVEKYTKYAKLEARQIIKERGYAERKSISRMEMVKVFWQMLYYGFKESFGLIVLKAGFLDGPYGIFVCTVKGFYYFIIHAQVFSYLYKRRHADEIRETLEGLGVPASLYLVEEESDD